MNDHAGESASRSGSLLSLTLDARAQIQIGEYRARVTRHAAPTAPLPGLFTKQEG